MANNAEKLVEGLRSRGVKLSAKGGCFHIRRDRGQPMINKAAGEAAPTWYLECNALWHGSRRVSGGEQPSVSFDGRSRDYVEVCSHMPLTWILKKSPTEWDISWCDVIRDRLNIFVDLPPNW